MMLIPEDVWEKLNQRLKDGETARAELGKQVDSLKVSQAKAVARADEAEKLNDDLNDDLQLERGKAQQIERDLRAKLDETTSVLTAERDGLKTALDDTN